MKIIQQLPEWQTGWGTPRGLFLESEQRQLEIAFMLALLLHLTPLGFLWHKQLTKKAVETTILQNVDLIEPEIEQPPAPAPVEVQKPKSALEFLKMAIPIFRKPAAEPEIPREIIPTPKIQEPKIAEPERLIDKKIALAPAAPSIKLDANRNLPVPKIQEIAKLPQSKSYEPVVRGPALKLEEVGRRAVAVPAQTPSISLDKSRMDKAVDLTSIPKTKLSPQAAQPTERLVERSAPAGYKPPTVSRSAPLGYERRDSGVSLDQPREVVRTVSKPQLETPIPKKETKDEAATIQISKEKVKITGPLSARKVVKSFIPEYPAWAKSRNIEADVAIRFTVSSDGNVLDTVIERTSGYQELDKLSIQELKKWKFSPLGSGQQDQWGVITFRFLLD